MPRNELDLTQQSTPGSRVHAPKSKLSLRNPACILGLSSLATGINQKQDQRKGKQIVSQHTTENVLNVSTHPGQTHRPALKEPLLHNH